MDSYLPGNPKRTTVIDTIETDTSWVVSQVEKPFQFVGDRISQAEDTAQYSIYAIDIAIVGVGLLIAYGLMKSFAQSNARDIGAGASDIIRSSK